MSTMAPRISNAVRTQNVGVTDLKKARACQDEIFDFTVDSAHSPSPIVTLLLFSQSSRTPQHQPACY